MKYKTIWNIRWVQFFINFPFFMNTDLRFMAKVQIKLILNSRVIAFRWECVMVGEAHIIYVQRPCISLIYTKRFEIKCEDLKIIYYKVFVEDRYFYRIMVYYIQTLSPRYITSKCLLYWLHTLYCYFLLHILFHPSHLFEDTIILRW